MNRKLTLSTLALAAGLVGCDLQVENTNDPDIIRALAAPEDVEALISGSFVKVWEIGHWATNANFPFDHMASRHTATWGNMGLNDLGREPREPLPNTPSYRWAYVFEGHWGDAYGGISAAADGIRAIDEGLMIGDGGERNPRALAFATGVQAILSCLLSLWYDSAFIVDETTDLTAELTTVDYTSMYSYAMDKLDTAEAMARGASFTLDEDWVNGNAWSNDEWADYLVAWKARCAANLPRTDAEAGSVDWMQVIQDARNGIADVVIEGEAGDSPWWDWLKTYSQQNNTWHRMHMDWVGMADQSGEYQDWLSFPTQQRVARQLTFEDPRFPPTNEDGVTSDIVSPSIASYGPRSRYNATIIFRPERGTYRQSHYGDMRYDEYTWPWDGNWAGPIEHMTVQEMDSYVAEGNYRMGNYAATAEIVNRTRAEAGLPPAPANATDPVPSTGGNCTPRKRYDVQGRCGNLQDAMWFEKFQNVFHVFGGLEHWHGRRNNLLPVNSALHLPIPAADLEVLQRDIYTFGGGGEASAEDPTPPAIVPGSLDSALERAAYSLRRLRAQQAQELATARNTPRTLDGR